MTLTTYLTNKDAHRNSTLFYTNGVATIRYNNKDYDFQQFSEAYPLPLKIISENDHLKGQNPDGTKRWMQLK